MIKYVIRRILFFIPSLIIISLLAFLISANAPGDAVERLMNTTKNSGEGTVPSKTELDQKIYWTKKLGLDLPAFYIGLRSLAEPDTLYKIYDKEERNALSRLISEYGNWSDIQQYYLSLIELEKFSRQPITDTSLLHSNDFKNDFINLHFQISVLKNSYDDRIIKMKFIDVKTILYRYASLAELQNKFEKVSQNYSLVVSQTSKWKTFIPAFSFYGNNQYHRWLFGDGNPVTGSGSVFTKGLIRGDLGISYITGQPVSQVIKEKIGWSLFFTLVSVLFAYLISIPLGAKAAGKRNSKFDRFTSAILYLMYSLPAFWFAILLLMTFANTDVLNWLPTSGVKPLSGYPADAGLFEKIKLSLPYLILPTICYTYSSVSFLSRTMRSSMLENLNHDYIRTARAKGLSEDTVIYKHALRNSLLPIITVFANIFPAVIGGSVILETIFSIPGMGSEIYNSIQTQNYPMIVAVFTIAGILTLTGYLVSDILYAFVDPRITFSKK